MPRIDKTVFISYRRRHVPWALAIAKYLTVEGYDVFMDFKNINSGDFEQVITESIRARAHFLVLLAPSALEKCDEPQDWLRKEILIALENKRNIIPILLEGFDFDSPEAVKYLTGPLETLSQYNALRLPADYFDEGITRLRERYLNIPLDAVRHPVSRNVQKIVKEQKQAVAKQEKVKEEKLSASEWFEKAYKAKEPEEKIRLYSKAIELDPTFAFAYNNRGLSYAKLKQHDRAIQDFNKAIELDPQYADAYNNRGSSYANLKQYERAIQDYNKAIELDPQDATAYNNRGISYNDQKQYERAIQDINKAIELDPTYAAAYNNRGNRYANLKQYEQAIQDYNKAIELDPQDATAYNNRGNSYANLKQYERAIQDINKAIELDPTYAAAYNNRGNRYANLKQYEQAIQDYNKAIELDPQYAVAYNNRGDQLRRSKAV